MKEKVIIVSRDFFDKLGIDYDVLDVIEKEENIFLVKIQSKESGLFIWSNGKNLESLNRILRIITKTNIGDEIRISIEVNNYLEQKDEHLKDFIRNKISIVEKNWEDLKLPFYNAYDRKKIHSFVSEYGNNKIYTKSIGEGKERRLYICKKDEKLTIDMDSIGI